MGPAVFNHLIEFVTTWFEVTKLIPSSRIGGVPPDLTSLVVKDYRPSFETIAGAAVDLITGYAVERTVSEVDPFVGTVQGDVLTSRGDVSPALQVFFADPVISRLEVADDPIT